MTRWRACTPARGMRCSSMGVSQLLHESTHSSPTSPPGPLPTTTHVCGRLKRLSDLPAEWDRLLCAVCRLALPRQRLDGSTCLLCRQAAVQEAVLAACVLRDQTEQDVFRCDLRAGRGVSWRAAGVSRLCLGTDEPLPVPRGRPGSSLPAVQTSPT